MDNELKKIKKKYGEEMMKFCREYFPTILEHNGVLLNILLDNFDVNRSLFDDLKENNLLERFKNYIYQLYTPGIKEEDEVLEHPKEIFDRLGYDFYECKSEEDIQKFIKYYAKGEELCTFRGGRLNSCHVFFVVRKDVDNIKRENFKNPLRQDEYGTSVMSIQFTRDVSHTLSIKNRYNHTVINPDATYSNDLENISPGLTKSFEKHYGLGQKNKSKSFEIPGYVKANDGKYYKYNYEIDNVYYCTNNVIIENFEVRKFDKEKYIVFDYFILDLVNKEMIDLTGYRESFTRYIVKIQNIKISLDKLNNRKEVIIVFEDNIEYKITLNTQNIMVSFESNIVKIPDMFLKFNKTLRSINLPNVQSIGDCFLGDNNTLESINITNVERIGNDFMSGNGSLKSLSITNVKEIGNRFLYDNNTLESINMPKVEKIGNCFMSRNGSVKSLFIPNVKEIGDSFLHNNNSLKSLSLPNVKIIGDDFLYNNRDIYFDFMSLPNDVIKGDNFLYVRCIPQEDYELRDLRDDSYEWWL